MAETRFCFECTYGKNDIDEGKCASCYPDPTRPHFEKTDMLTKDSASKKLECPSGKGSIDTYDKIEPQSFDIVKNPQHYCDGKHECIDVMENLFGTQAVIDFCKCNIFKYRFRAGKKNGDEDIKKAEWYEAKLMELIAKRKAFPESCVDD